MITIRQSDVPTYVKPSRGVLIGTAAPTSAEQLIRAARAGNIEAIQQGLSSDVDVNSRWNGTTALLAAIVSGQFEAVKCLLSKNADVEARDNDGLTILKLALDNNHRFIAEYIIKTCPYVTVTDPRLPEGEEWLREQFRLITNAVKRDNSKPRTEVLKDVPLDIERNYSAEVQVSLMGTFNTFLFTREGVKYCAWLLNSKLPTTHYEIKGTVVDEEAGWVTERWGYRDERNITVDDGIDSFVIDYIVE